MKGLRARVVAPIAAVVLALAAGYGYTELDSGGGGATPGASATARGGASAPAGGTQRASATGSPRTATAQAPTANRRDLEADERAGGHTLERHVGKSDAELRERLEDEPNISAASTYYDREAAEESVAFALADQARRLEEWERRSGDRPNLALRTTADEDVGRSWERGEDEAEDVAGIVVVLAWDEDESDWFVLTSYPEDER